MCLNMYAAEASLSKQITYIERNDRECIIIITSES